MDFSRMRERCSDKHLNHIQKGDSMKKDWVFNHMGTSFRDLRNALEYFESTGMGPRMPWGFRPPAAGAPKPSKQPKRPGNITLTNGIVDPPPENPDPSGFILGTPCVQVGTLQIEGMGVFSLPGRTDFAKEGVSHICFDVPDIQAETAALVAKGIQVNWALLASSGLMIEDYLDTREFGNIIISFRPLANRSKPWMDSIMAHPLVSDWQFCGMGFPVRDLDKAVEYYQFLDIGVVQPEVMFDSSSISDFKVNGETPGAAVKARTRAFTDIGPLSFEFIQPLEGESLYREHLDRRGEEANVCEFAFTVTDLEKETAKLVEKGVPVIFSGKPEAGKAFACFDTREHGADIAIKLMQAEISPLFTEMYPEVD